MSVSLDRIALEDVGAQPQRMAQAILEQLGYRDGPVPIEEIARALDIDEIRIEPLTNFEGALLTTPDRDCGSILINSNAGPRRRRFTIGHELGHFLIRSHTGSYCSSNDMQVSSARGDAGRRRQEAEANCFAIEILAPRQASAKFLNGGPDMAQILAMADAFDISRAAAARRFVELHSETVAIVFSKSNRVTYIVESEGFARMAIGRDDLLPLAPQGSQATGISPREDADASFWLSHPPADCELTQQTLSQKDHYTISLLHLVGPDKDVEPDLEDVFDRFGRFNER